MPGQIPAASIIQPAQKNKHERTAEAVRSFSPAALSQVSRIQKGRCFKQRPYVCLRRNYFSAISFRASRREKFARPFSSKPMNLTQV